MKLITFDQIQELKIDVKQCYQWVADMIKNKSDTMLPPKISMKPSPEIFINFMPSFVNRQVGGIKIVSRYPERTPSLDSKLILLDITSGEYLAIMDADWITTMRTGAVAVHSIKLLAKQDYSTIGMIGLGNTARATLLTLAEIESTREFEIKLFKYKGPMIIHQLSGILMSSSPASHMQKRISQLIQISRKDAWSFLYIL